MPNYIDQQISTPEDLKVRTAFKNMYDNIVSYRLV